MKPGQVQEDKASNTQVARSAFKVSLGSVFNLAAGIVSQVLIAAFFGAGIEMDAYLTSLVVPSYIQAVLLGGLSFVFIPEFIRATKEEKEESAWELVGTFFWLILVVLTILAFGGFVFSDQILDLTAPGLSAEKKALSDSILKILIFSIPFAGLATLTGGVQNARHRFFWPAFAPAIGSIGNLIILLLLYQQYGPLALAWGFLASEILRAAVNVIPVVRHGWSSRTPLGDPRILEMLRLITPFILFGIITRSTDLFERFFASGLPDGDLSYIGYATKIGKSFGSILRSGVVVAIFPAMAAAYVERGKSGLVDRMEFGIKVTLATTLPAFALISALSVPLIMIIYERGEFLHSVTLNVSRILPFLVFREICLVMLGNVLVRGFYVTKDTRTPPIVSTVTSSLYIILATLLVGLSGYVGLAVARPASAVVGTITLSLLLFRRLKVFNFRHLFNKALIYSLASVVAYFTAWQVSATLISAPALLRLVLGGALGAAMYLGMIYRFDPDMLDSIFELSGISRIFRGVRVGVLRIARMAQQ